MWYETAVEPRQSSPNVGYTAIWDKFSAGLCKSLLTVLTGHIARSASSVPFIYISTPCALILLCPRQHSGSIKWCRFPSVMSICPIPPAQKRRVLELRSRYHRKLRETPLSKVEAVGERGRMATRSYRNVLETEKQLTSISRKPSEIQPWLKPN